MRSGLVKRQSGKISYRTKANRLLSGDHEFTLIVPCPPNNSRITRIFDTSGLPFFTGISRNYFSGDPVSRSDAREVAQAWEPFCSVATWYIWRSLDPLPVAY